MEPLSLDRLQSIADARGLSYEPLEDADPLVVRTRVSRPFPVPQQTAFDAFSDPMSHVPLFSIIKGSTPAIRAGIDRLIPENQFFAFEHVEESALPPRLMLVRYTLNPPLEILKEAVTDPFMLGGDEVMDKKRGRVRLLFEKLTDDETRIVAESTFQSTTGAVFARGFIDHVWLNFFERMMVVNGMMSEKEYLTSAE